MLLGVNSKHQEKMREDWENLKNENNFYVRKMKKMRKKMKELEETKKRLEDCIEEDTKRYINCDKRWRERGTQIYNLEEENKKLKEQLQWKDKEIKAYEKEALNHGQIALRQEEEIKDLKEEDYKSFGVMFVEKEDGDEDDIDFFDTEFEAQKLMNELISSNTTSSHPYPEGKLILFRSHKYNPDYDNSGTVPIVREMKIATSAVDNLDSLLGQLKKRTKFLEKTRK